ncbi:hypothetical protein K457DRAFT_570971 [Linnemannia elongata AG-77]|uniref:Uncharacterized protein n=1 Tax=Linnemannia elongata AG-77 TaxID=1314771 RepID=A0A197KDS4_9FUNG|nr:hypothetical protein K457DRAFT_570971 [Linnemannia elongata AG-77]
MREGGEVGIRVLYRMGWDAWNKRKEVTSKRAIGLLCLLHYFYSEKCNRRHIRCLPLPLYFFAPVTLLPCSCYSLSLPLLLSPVYSNYHCQTELLNLVPFFVNSSPGCDPYLLSHNSPLWFSYLLSYSGGEKVKVYGSQVQ